MKNIVLLCCSIFFCCCNHTPQELLSPTILQPQTVISELNDSTFFSQILGMCYDHSKIYLSEAMRGQILVLNEDYTLNHIIGNKGKGPGEFLFNAQLDVAGDSLFVVNGKDDGISLFVNNKYIRNISDRKSDFYGHIGSFELRFAYARHFLYYFPLSRKNEILKYNLETQEVSVFATSSSPDKNSKNRGHVVSDGEYIYVVIHNAPLVEKYSLSGKRKEIYDYSNRVDFMKTLDRISVVEQKPGHGITLVQNVCVNDHYLYMLLCLWDYSDNLIGNTVLVINTEKKSDFKLYQLDDGVYMSMAVFKNKILAFDVVDAELKSFSLQP